MQSPITWLPSHVYVCKPYMHIKDISDTYIHACMHAYHRCIPCPAGAMCTGTSTSSQVCYFGKDVSQCRSAPVGTWAYRNSRLYLESCAATPGYSRVVTLDGVFNHDIQTCKKCDPRFEYIIDTEQPCQECPAGLECAGVCVYVCVCVYACVCMCVYVYVYVYLYV